MRSDAHSNQLVRSGSVLAPQGLNKPQLSHTWRQSRCHPRPFSAEEAVAAPNNAANGPNFG